MAIAIESEGARPTEIVIHVADPDLPFIVAGQIFRRKARENEAEILANAQHRTAIKLAVKQGLLSDPSDPEGIFIQRVNDAAASARQKPRSVGVTRPAA